MNRKKVTKARARKCLEEIASIINCSEIGRDNKNASQEARSFRDIVTALRGPDDEKSPFIKRDTTGVIRRLIGIADGSGLITSVEPLDYAEQLIFKSGEHFHFTTHIKRAVYGLRYLQRKPRKVKP